LHLVQFALQLWVRCCRTCLLIHGFLHHVSIRLLQ
jgi:hypothetical protein